MNDFVKKAKAVMIGHAIGDALGVPVEFCSRESLDSNPVTDMFGYGAHSVPKGTWSDDTSMALCALESLSKGKLDYDDIMNNFCKWYYRGEFTSNGSTFDVGGTCNEAINNYSKRGLPYDKCGLADEYSNGNGSLMRIHPFTLFLINSGSHGKMFLLHIDEICRASALTHAHPRSKIACVLYSFILWELIENPIKSSVINGLNNAYTALNHYCEGWEAHWEEYTELPHFNKLRRIEKLGRDEIKSDGYVVHTLEAAIWCLLTTDSFEECVLKAVNLGYDSDTTAAVAGGLAGALYGYDAIPEEWRNTLIKREYIEELCEKAFNN